MKPAVYLINNENAAPRHARHLEFIDADKLQPEPIRWLWDGWLARGKFHLLAGPPGTGKTTIAMDLAARISAGNNLPNGVRVAPGNVIIWSGEDDSADTLVPRLIASGADRSKIKFIGDVTDGGPCRPFDPARDVDKLSAAVRQVGNVSMIIIDPIVNAVSGDCHKNSEVRRSLSPLVELSADIDACLLGITHYSKGTADRDPLERVTGSLAFGALARIVLCTGVMGRTEQHQVHQMLLLARTKSNIGPDGSAFSFFLVQQELPGLTKIMTSRIQWQSALLGSARELLNGRESKRELVDDLRPSDWLTRQLSDGEVAVSELRRRATEARIPWRNLQRAMRLVGAKSKKKGFGDTSTWSILRTPIVAPKFDGEMPSPEGADGADGADGAGFLSVPPDVQFTM